MEEVLIVIAVIVLALGGIVGIAYSLDARRRRHGILGPKLPPAGSIGRLLWWVARLLATAMVVLVASAYLFKAPELAWLAAVGLVLFFADHVAYRIVRLTGK